MVPNPNILADRIRDLRRLNSGHQWFIPQLSLYQLMSRDAIRRALQDTGTEPYNLDEMVEYISRNGIKIFAILVLIDQGAFASSFVKAKLTDQQLPFSSDTLCNHLSPQSSGHFYERQWKFTALAFHRSTTNRTFSSISILPFVDEKFIGSGSFASVYEIKLDSCHQQLEGPFQHRV